MLQVPPLRDPLLAKAGIGPFPRLDTERIALAVGTARKEIVVDQSSPLPYTPTRLRQCAWLRQVLSPLALVLEETIVRCAADAAVDVRSLGRQAIIAYSAAYSERSLVVAMRLDASTRALVEEEARAHQPTRTPDPP